MKFGLMLAGQFLPGDDPVQHMEETLEQVRIARDSGFDSIWMVQHFLADFQFFQPIPFLARIAAESGQMSLGTAVLLVTYYPPVALSEELATLDIITNGRLIIGAGTGYREAEFNAFGLDIRKRVSRFTETIELLRQLWTGEEVNFQGKHFQIGGVRQTLLPVQKPGIPIWIGAQGEQGIRRAARIGDEWIVTPELPFSEVKRRTEIYRQALVEAGRSTDRAYPLSREVCVAETMEAALAAARGPLETKYGAYARWGHQVGTVDALIDNAFIVGDPDTCIEKIQRYVDEIGTRHFLFRVQWPGMDAKASLKTIELLGTRVLPELRKSLNS